ncbi:MAG: YggS family pyridoxal phosphate-dependent enzyme [Anaerolineaceae bacterium]|nr:YggS family pyridoxal phosphate-dependent enzyme [Anaerolineaceae bacterium]
MNSKISNISESFRQILHTIPTGVLLLAAAKTRTLEEVEAAIQAGITAFGYNYVQEALPIIQEIGDQTKWHMIGHLQQNKVSVAVKNFDMIETVDSWRLAQALDHQCAKIQKKMPVLVEVNSGREVSKTGVLPEAVDDLIIQMSSLKYLSVEGLMTMGPRFGDPEDSRPYFKATREVFERIAARNLPNIAMKYLSMGMSNSYQIAIEEGATIIRIGTKLFGER